MDLYCYESIEEVELTTNKVSDSDSVCFRCFFSNVKGYQIIQTLWFYDNMLHPKEMKGIMHITENGYVFECIRDQVLRIKIVYDKAKNATIFFTDDDIEKECVCVVLVDRNNYCTTVSVLNV